jgi:outer membrane protein assembly factor BamB
MEHPSQDAWRRVALLDDGSLLAIHEGLGILKLNAASELQWYDACGAHHDLFVAANGHVFVLTRKPRILSRLNQREPILEDAVTELDADGGHVRTVSVVDCMLASPWADDVVRAARAGGDILHTNTLELVDERLAARLAGVAPGQVLVCLRELDAIATLDLERRRMTWLARAGFAAPHDPTVLDDGSLLVFDNMGRAGRSRVVQFDPVSGATLWSYSGDLYSVFCGTAARLRGGNTLVTESCAGRALEVDPEGRVVWSFASPHRAGPGDALVAALFEVQRLGLDHPLDWLE